MNEYLLYSSIITGCILLLIIYNNYTPKYNILYLFIFLGIITSILNHGFYSITYKYIDRFIMIVNVASRCGLTKSSYTLMSDLYKKYKNHGLEILAFPCNQFAS